MTTDVGATGTGDAAPGERFFQTLLEEETRPVPASPSSGVAITTRSVRSARSTPAPTA